MEFQNIVTKHKLSNILIFKVQRSTTQAMNNTLLMKNLQSLAKLPTHNHPIHTNNHYLLSTLYPSLIHYPTIQQITLSKTKIKTSTKYTTKSWPSPMPQLLFSIIGKFTHTANEF